MECETFKILSLFKKIIECDEKIQSNRYEYMKGIFQISRGKKIQIHQMTVHNKIQKIISERRHYERCLRNIMGKLKRNPH